MHSLSRDLAIDARPVKGKKGEANEPKKVQSANEDPRRSNARGVSDRDKDDDRQKPAESKNQIPKGIILSSFSLEEDRPKPAGSKSSITTSPQGE